MSDLRCLNQDGHRLSKTAAQIDLDFGNYEKDLLLFLKDLYYEAAFKAVQKYRKEHPGELGSGLVSLEDTELHDRIVMDALGGDPEDLAKKDTQRILEKTKNAVAKTVAHLRAARQRAGVWHGSRITATLSYKGLFERSAYSYQDPLEPIDALYVRVHDGVVSKNSPGFSMWGDGTVDDVLDVGDTDFFRDSGLEQDYFILVNELRKPGSTKARGKRMVLYTARPIKDRGLYKNTKTIPSGVFLSNDFNDAFGFGQDFGGSERTRDVYKIILEDENLVPVLDVGRVKHYQTIPTPSKRVPIVSIEPVYLADTMKTSQENPRHTKKIKSWRDLPADVQSDVRDRVQKESIRRLEKLQIHYLNKMEDLAHKSGYKGRFFKHLRDQGRSGKSIHGPLKTLDMAELMGFKDVEPLLDKLQPISEEYGEKHQDVLGYNIQHVWKNVWKDVARDAGYKISSDIIEWRGDLPITEDTGREAEVGIHFHTKEMEPDAMSKLQEVERILGELGIGFDTGFGFPDGIRDWEWDWSLTGPVSVEFKRNVDQDPQNRYVRGSWLDERWKLADIPAESDFEKAVKNKTFKHPDTGNKVKFKSLPPETQARVRSQFNKKLEKRKPAPFAPRTPAPLGKPLGAREIDAADEDGNQMYQTDPLPQEIQKDFDAFKQAAGGKLQRLQMTNGALQSSDSEGSLRTQGTAFQLFSKLKPLAQTLGKHPSMQNPEVHFSRGPRGRGGMKASLVFGKSPSGNEWDEEVPQLHVTWDSSKPEDLHIDLIMIPKVSRGKGVGRQVLQGLRDQVRSMGISTVSLEPGNQKFWSQYTGQNITDKYETITFQASWLDERWARGVWDLDMNNIENESDSDLENARESLEQGFEMARELHHSISAKESIRYRKICDELQSRGKKIHRWL